MQTVRKREAQIYFPDQSNTKMKCKGKTRKMKFPRRNGALSQKPHPLRVKFGNPIFATDVFGHAVWNIDEKGNSFLRARLIVFAFILNRVPHT